MSHTRVIPRDLFNEAKLLKCLGKITLWMLDGLTPPGLRHDAEDGAMGAFRIEQDPGDGGLFLANLGFTIGGEPVLFRTCYNDKSRWPLVMRFGDDEWEPIKEDGSMETEAFAELAEAAATILGREVR